LIYAVTQNATLHLASEIKALWQAGVEAKPDAVTWATYLSQGHYDHSERTFWDGVRSLPAGHKLVWEQGQLQTSCWYDLAARVPRECDPRPIEEVREEYRGIIEDSVRLRFRSDVPVGINISGGLDSSLLLGLTERHWGSGCDLHAFTFVSGDPRYDETPWVRRMLAHTGLRSVLCELRAEEIPALAECVQSHQDEPFGGLPTLAYARLFEQARARKVVVLLDGQGLDEQWAGYDYFAGDGAQTRSVIQGTTESPVRPDCLAPEFRSLARPFEFAPPFPDRLRNLQYRDIRYTKIPRALRFNDRVSMRCSTELREPFLDHRLFELAMSQPAHHKIVNGTRKWLVRQLAAELAPAEVVQAPKRPVQTPQREWLRGPLRSWAEARIEDALAHTGGSWLRADRVRWAWRRYCAGVGDNSFYVWQWISLGLLMRNGGTRLHG
jgi:asparagine synthase (glutamine-hydrolysing)